MSQDLDKTTEELDFHKEAHTTEELLEKEKERHLGEEATLRNKVHVT